MINFIEILTHEILANGMLDEICARLNVEDEQTKQYCLDHIAQAVNSQSHVRQNLEAIINESTDEEATLTRLRQFARSAVQSLQVEFFDNEEDLTFDEADDEEPYEFVLNDGDFVSSSDVFEGIKRRFLNGNSVWTPGAA